MFLSKNLKLICDAVVNDWVSDFDELDDHFKLKLSWNDFYHKIYPVLGNKTINNYLKDVVKKLTGQSSSYKYPTFKRRAEILFGNSKISNLVFDNVDKTTILNGLLIIKPNNVKSVNDFFIEKDKFDFTLWSDYLLEQNQILGIEFADEIFLFSTLCYIRNIVSFYGLLPYQVELSIDDDCIFFYCVDFSNMKYTFFVSLTNPLASHFI